MAALRPPAARWSADGSSFDYANLTGRFTIPTAGHLAVIRQAQQWARRVNVFVGSAEESPKPYNPFPWEQRVEMLTAALTPSELERVTFRPVCDSPYRNQDWMSNVRQACDSAVAETWGPSGFTGAPAIALAGCRKDAPTEEYLNFFPEWPLVDISQKWNINATDVRQEYFLPDLDVPPQHVARRLNEGGFDHLIPRGVANWLARYALTPEYDWMRGAFMYAAEYQRKRRKGAWHPNNVTGDALVFCAGHVLLVQRGRYPGLGQWAIPGGHVEEMEWPEAAALRELNEETRLFKHLKRSRLIPRGKFEAHHPRRSSLGIRTWTTAYAYEVILQGDEALPVVEPKTPECLRAEWVRFNDIRCRVMFDDHFHLYNELRPLIGQNH